MAPLAFLLECAAIAAITGFAGSLLALALFAVSKPLSSRWAAAHQANLLFFFGTLPAVISITVVTATGAPSIAGALGLAADHCPTHPHHVHLCIVHAAGLRPLLATVGAFSLALFVFRAGALGKRMLETRAYLGALERLGHSRDARFPIVQIPGAPRLCHAVGVFRRRVLISQALSELLPSDELAAALAHEEAHLRRQDPAARLWLAVASLVTWPHVASFFQRRFHQATEQACDAEAATAVGNPSLVAMALVNSAGLLKHADEPSTLVAAFGESPLEHRVHLLLQESTPRVAPARALFVSLLPAAVSLGIGLSQSEHVHHAVETLLHHFF